MTRGNNNCLINVSVVLRGAHVWIDKESRLRTVVNGSACLFKGSRPAHSSGFLRKTTCFEILSWVSLGCFSVPVLLISLLAAGRDSGIGSTRGAWLRWRDEQLLLVKVGGLSGRQAGDMKAAYGNPQTALLKGHHRSKPLLWRRLQGRPFLLQAL